MKLIVLALVAGLITGALLEQYLNPPKTKTVEIEKVVRDTKTVTITKPDGTIIKKETKKETEDISKEKTVEKKKDWYIQIDKDIYNGNSIGLSVGRRIIGDIYIGGNVRGNNFSNATLGVSLLVLF